jgi:hypothetical protein
VISSVLDFETGGMRNTSDAAVMMLPVLSMHCVGLEVAIFAGVWCFAWGSERVSTRYR